MWDDSLLSRDEADARTKRKAEAVMKRERALAYAYSHQVRLVSTVETQQSFQKATQHSTITYV